MKGASGPVMAGPLSVPSPATLLVALAGGLSGCATGGGPATSDDVLVPREDAGVVVVARDLRSGSAGCPHRIAIDDRPAGDLLPGQWLTLYPAPGEHVLALRLVEPCAGAARVRIRVVGRQDQRFWSVVERDGVDLVEAAGR